MSVENIIHIVYIINKYVIIRFEVYTAIFIGVGESKI